MKKLIAQFLICMMLIVLAACGDSEPEAAPIVTPPATLVASLTFTPPPTATTEATAEITLTPSPTGTLPVITLIPSGPTGERVPPPIDITLPEGWEVVGYDTMQVPEFGGVSLYPFALYRGPVTGGTARIVLLWGFPGLLSSGTGDTEEANLFSNGLLLWRTIVIEDECNIGTDLQRDFSIGGLTGTGTYVSAVDCPSGAPNVAGYFVGTQQDGLNFIFYAYVDPPEAFSAAGAELEAILNTVDFRVADLLTATRAPELTETP